MFEKLNLVVLDHRDPTQNMSRFYVLAIEPSLFGDATLVREWGRIGKPGRRRVELHENEGRAVESLENWLRRKQKRGYRIRAGGSI
ncbi:WGR domain-containing protein (plasmid) [Microvirga terrae]|uniref:WGR domain-containing protein n=1 Tax=Microvirga terrae TaxID=2740529 RepID=A0ABY5S0T2_9HYPH|nr:WGR domain-containing protein [Microvirga terrae]UVF22814.1 WGR domain-containing protein [Microvirga terrae]